jgi:hypothetical protein
MSESLLHELHRTGEKFKFGAALAIASDVSTDLVFSDDPEGDETYRQAIAKGGRPVCFFGIGLDEEGAVTLYLHRWIETVAAQMKMLRKRDPLAKSN